MFLYEECCRLLRRSNEILIETPSVNDDQVRAINVLSFSIRETAAEVLPEKVKVNSDGENSHADSPRAVLMKLLNGTVLVLGDARSHVCVCFLNEVYCTV